MAATTTQPVDTAGAGAGFAGMYLLHRLRGLGLTAAGAKGLPDRHQAPVRRHRILRDL